MSDIAIKIENLGKRYKYGAAQSVSSNLRADLTDWARGVFRRGDRSLKPEAGSLKPEAGRLQSSVISHQSTPAVSSLPQTTAASRPTRLQSASESSGISLSATGACNGLRLQEALRSCSKLKSGVKFRND